MKYFKLALLIVGYLILVYISPAIKETMTRGEEVPEEIVEEVIEVSPEEVQAVEKEEHVEPEEREEFKGVLIPSNLTSEELERGLLHDLKLYAPVFIQAEKETGINAVFLASISALESGWARSNVSKTNNNLFGWTSSKGYKSFNSKDECILYVAGRIKELYLTEGGAYFNGYEIEDVNIKYNGSEHWESNVKSIMKQIKMRIEEE